MEYKVGDKVRIKDTDIEGTIENIIRGQFIVDTKVSKIPAWPEDIEMVLNGKEVMLKLADIELPSGRIDIWECPNGYQFVDENGNVINATKIVLEKKKKEYPKTFDKCCHILQTAFLCDVRLHKGKYYDIFYALAKLIVCRDAYWKIAGEEMGLGEPWEPDYDSGDDKFGIICLDGVVQESNPTTNWERHLNKILDFPTREMRDAFKENFKELIEQCKELL